MDLEKKLKELSEYDIAFEIKNGFYHISVKYNENWSVLTPENEYIHAEERNNLFHYIGNMDNVTMDDIFNAIDKTIHYNQDLEMKLELFKEKTDELQKLFAEEKYEVLKTLKFDIKRLKKKTTAKQKTNNIENNENNKEILEQKEQ